MPNRLRFFTFFGARKQVPHRVRLCASDRSAYLSLPQIPLTAESVGSLPNPLRRLASVFSRSVVPFPSRSRRISLACDRSAKKLYVFHTASPRLSVVCRCRASYHAVRPASLSLPLSYSPLPALGYFFSCHTKSPLRQPLRCRKGDFSVCLLLWLCAPAQQYAT